MVIFENILSEEVGVLTKPDRIPPTTEDSWLRYIRNEVEALEHNWFCVKQPGPDILKRGITWDEARSQEKVFFALTNPWSGLDSPYKNYLGTERLLERASTILSDLIAKRSGLYLFVHFSLWFLHNLRLPEIQEEVRELLSEARSLLEEMPDEPSDQPVSEVMEILHTFSRDLEREMDGVADENGLLQRILPKKEDFRKAIRMTAPNFIPFEKSQNNQYTLSQFSFLNNEETEEDLDAYEETQTTSSTAIYIDEVLHRATT